MTWIESHDSLRDHPKTRRAARALGIRTVQMIGHLHCLWWWAMAYADDGDLSDFDDADVSDAAEWDGEPEIFITALVESGPGVSPGFLDRDNDGALHVHNWDLYAGKLVARREANKQRMRDARAQSVQNTCDARAASVQSHQPTVPTVPTNKATDAHTRASHRLLDFGVSQTVIDRTIEDFADIPAEDWPAEATACIAYHSEGKRSPPKRPSTAWTNWLKKSREIRTQRATVNGNGRPIPDYISNSLDGIAVDKERYDGF